MNYSRLLYPLPLRNVYARDDLRKGALPPIEIFLPGIESFLRTVLCKAQSTGKVLVHTRYWNHAFRWRYGDTCNSHPGAVPLTVLVTYTDGPTITDDSNAADRTFWNTEAQITGRNPIVAGMA